MWTINRKLSSWGLPPINDPRYLFLVLQLIWVTYSLVFPAYSRSVIQFVVCVSTAAILDFACHRYFRGINFFPFSGILSSLGAFLMCDANGVWPYFTVAALSILSKHLIRVERHHVFNPNNFGIVACVLLFPLDITMNAARWGGFSWIWIAVAGTGVIIAAKAHRLWLTGGFMATFLAGAYVRALISGRPFEAVCAPLTGAAFYLYLFFHITDPKTTPERRAEQLAFGVALGVVDAYLRYQQMKFAPFFALFLICPLYTLIREYRRQQKMELAGT